MTALEDWTHAIADVPVAGLHRERTASQAERDALSRALKIPALEALMAKYHIRALPGGGYRLSGHLKGRVVQSCIVTLEPVAADIDDEFVSEFWPDPAHLDAEGEKAVLDMADIEPLKNGIIDAGRIIFEALSAGLDPYPRKSGVEFDWQDPAAKNPEKTSPFAVLGKLKSKE